MRTKLRLATALIAALVFIPATNAHVADSVIAITGGPSGSTTERTATFSFGYRAGGDVAYTTCALDERSESRCESPVTFVDLGPGQHAFEVRAYGSRGGVVGSDSRSWTVVAQDPPTTDPGPTQPDPGPIVDPKLPLGVPDFYLTAPGGEQPHSLKPPVKQVVLRPGEKGTATIVVVRLYGSQGGFSYSFSPLAPGVTTGVSQDSYSNPKEVTVVFFAAYNAKPVDTKVTMTAKPSSPAAGPAPRSIEIPYIVVQQYDLAVSGIDITQGIQLPQSQTSTLPARDPANPNAPVPYPPAVKLDVVAISPWESTLTLVGAAPLVQRKGTTVRVFAVVAGPSALQIKGAGMLLHGRAKDGSPLPYSPLKSSTTPTLFPGDPYAVSLTQLRKQTGAFSFKLPKAWTDRDWLELEAQLLPPMLYGKAECTLAACDANNHFRLTNIPLGDTGYVDIWPLAFVRTGQNPPDNVLTEPPAVFKTTAKALPLEETRLQSGTYRAYYEATGVSQKTVLATVKAYVSDLPNACKSWFMPFRPTTCPDVVAGVVAGWSPGVTAGGENMFPPRPGIMVVNQSRPLTSVAHETGHTLGFHHADTACGGGSDDQEAEGWWPDPNGLLYGLTIGGNGTLVGSNTLPSGFTPWYDFMSYCANNSADNDSWISIINWRRAYDVIAGLQKVRTSAAYSSRQDDDSALSVIGYVEGDGIVITRIRPTSGPGDVGPQDSRYRIVLRDGAGGTIAEAPMRVDVADGHGGDTTLVSVELPLPGGSLPAALHAVEIIEEGTVKARVVRTAHPPTVAVERPRRGGRGTLALRWIASDDDDDALTATVDYSADDGRSWRTVFSGANADAVVLPSRLFAASKLARIRVSVSDGIDETAVVGPRFVSDGAPPVVEITSPAGARATFGVGEPVNLEATAFDDASRALRGRSVAWYDGARRIGLGESATVVDLAPGLHRIRVVARDRLGRTGTDVVRVRVRPVAPQLIVHRAPATVSRVARAVRLRVSSTLPARVSVSGLRGPSWDVTARPRDIVVPIKPGTRMATFVLRARAFGRTSSLRVSVEKT